MLFRSRARTRRRKSLWNLLLPVLVIPIWLTLWWLAFGGTWRFHVLLYPSHAHERNLFWTSGLPLRLFLPSFLMLIPAAFPSLVWSMLITNCVLRLVPPARRTFDYEAKGYPGTDYRSAQAGLFVVALVFTTGWVVLAVAGAATLVAMA